MALLSYDLTDRTAFDALTNAAKMKAFAVLTVLRAQRTLDEQHWRHATAESRWSYSSYGTKHCPVCHGNRLGAALKVWQIADRTGLTEGGVRAALKTLGKAGMVWGKRRKYGTEFMISGAATLRPGFKAVSYLGCENGNLERFAAAGNTVHTGPLGGVADVLEQMIADVQAAEDNGSTCINCGEASHEGNCPCVLGCGRPTHPGPCLPEDRLTAGLERMGLRSNTKAKVLWLANAAAGLEEALNDEGWDLEHEEVAHWIGAVRQAVRYAANFNYEPGIHGKWSNREPGEGRPSPDKETTMKGTRTPKKAAVAAERRWREADRERREERRYEPHLWLADDEAEDDPSWRPTRLCAALGAHQGRAVVEEAGSAESGPRAVGFWDCCGKRVDSWAC